MPAKKPNKPKTDNKSKAAPPASTAAFERVEFQAPPGWTVKLDRAAEALGLSRSAYIRQACIRQMKADGHGD